MSISSNTFDSVVVGGGVMGLSLAWELAQHGVKVCIIDRGPIGAEASWAAAGMLPPGPPSELWHRCSAYDQLQGLGHQMHPQWHEHLAELTGIDNGYRQTGAIYLGESQHVDSWNQWELSFQDLDTTALSDLEPELVSTQARAVLLPSESQLRPPWHLKALTAACQRVGVELRPGCELLDWRVQNGRVIAAVTSLGEISAENFCLAGGCWSGMLGTKLGVELPIRPVRGQILLLRGTPGTLGRIVNAGPRYLTPRPDGRILVGSTQEDAGFNKQNTLNGVAELLNFARKLCPALGEFDLEKSWSGLRPGTPDELPYLGRLPHLANAWVAAGHFRAGIQLSPATAVVMRALMLGQEPQVDLREFSVSR